MDGIIALLPLLLQFIEQGITMAPELIAELKAIFAGLNPSNPALTPAQEQAINDVLVKINAAVQAS